MSTIMIILFIIIVIVIVIIIIIIITIMFLKIINIIISSSFRRFDTCLRFGRSFRQDAPPTHLQLEHVYGYNGDLNRLGGHERYGTNAVWLRSGDMVFPVGHAAF
jgi:hypothetical protein